MQKFFDWYDTQPPPKEDVSPWLTVPDEIQQAHEWNWRNPSILTRPIQPEAPTRNSEYLAMILAADQATDDELGRLIEGSVHGYMHEVGAGVFNEPELEPVMMSPVSSLFTDCMG